MAFSSPSWYNSSHHHGAPVRALGLARQAACSAYTHSQVLCVTLTSKLKKKHESQRAGCVKLEDGAGLIGHSIWQANVTRFCEPSTRSLTSFETFFLTGFGFIIFVFIFLKIIKK